MNNPVKRAIIIVLSCLAVLFAGYRLFLTGADLMHKAHANSASARERPRVVSNSVHDGETNFVKMLNLTEEQRPKVEAIMDASRSKLKVFMNDTSLSKEEKTAKLHAIFAATMQEMRPLLHPDQQKKLEQFHNVDVQAHPVTGSDNTTDKPWTIHSIHGHR